jgi:hypothetical protein
MKKIIALLLCACCFASVSAGCGYTDALDKAASSSATSTDDSANQSSSSNDDENKVNASDYSSNLDGLVQYFVDMNYIKDSVVKNKTEMDYSLLGATSGYKFTVSNNFTIELYEFDNKADATAKEIISSVKQDGSFSILGLNPVTAYLSDNEKYLMIYSDKSINDEKPDTSSSNYVLRDEVIENFKAFQ